MAKLNLRGALATALLLIAEAAGAQADAGHLGHHPPPAAAAAPMPATPSAAQAMAPETPMPMPTTPARPAPMAMPAAVAPGMAAPAPAAAPGTAPAAPAMPAAAPGMAGGGMMMDMMGKMMAPASPGAAAMPAAPAPGMAGMPAPAAAGGCMGMGCGAGGAGTSPIYPSLMTLPALTPEKRAEIEALGNQQLSDGMGRLASSYEALNHAAQASDHAAMQQAAGLMREALGQVGSGIAARRVLTEGKSPRNLALDWFKREMSLASPIAAVAAGPTGGVRLFHFITMLSLIAFAVAMVAIYVLRMRRAAALFGRLEGGSGGPPPPPPPPADGKPPPTAPSGTQNAPADAPAAASAAPKAEPAAVAADTTVDTPPVSAKWLGQLRVGSVIVETPSVKTLRLLPSSGTGLLPFTFLPGQFLNLSLWIGGAKMNRSYSISSSPTQRGFVDLTVKREPRGAVSRHLDDLLEVGDLIDVGGPVGKFTFTGAEASSIVLIAGGVGITPMMSIARTLSAMAWPGDIYFFYACRAPPDFIFAKELAALQQQNLRLHVTVTMEMAEGIDWAGPVGRITKGLLTQAVPALITRRVHLCGPPMMMQAIKALLSELGVPPEQVKTEDFGTAAPQAAAAGTAAKSAAPATGPLVTFSKNSKASKSRPDQTVLELSEELGIGIEFSCRVGTCGVCKVAMTSGDVEMAVDDALDAEDRAKGIILACQAKPKIDCVVEA
ncbi:MAG: FAD-binding oxidoreductase [Stagnimonas sp.]|nr:FAD-binding oxidoreductase [Stagnimonas sp.]